MNVFLKITKEDFVNRWVIYNWRINYHDLCLVSLIRLVKIIVFIAIYFILLHNILKCWNAFLSGNILNTGCLLTSSLIELKYFLHILILCLFFDYEIIMLSLHFVSLKFLINLSFMARDRNRCDCNFAMRVALDESNISFDQFKYHLDQTDCNSYAIIIHRWSLCIVLIDYHAFDQSKYQIFQIDVGNNHETYCLYFFLQHIRHLNRFDIFGELLINIKTLIIFL